MLKYLRESIAAVHRTHAIVVRFYVDLATVKRVIPSSIGKLTEQSGGIRLDAQADDLGWFARELSRLDVEFDIVKPKALRTALVLHLRQLLKSHS